MSAGLQHSLYLSFISKKVNLGFRERTQMKKIALIKKYRHLRCEISARIILDQEPHTLQDIEGELRQYNKQNSPAVDDEIDYIIEIPQVVEHPFGDILDLILLPPTPEGVEEINKLLTFVVAAAFSRGSVHGHNEAVREH